MTVVYDRYMPNEGGDQPASAHKTPALHGAVSVFDAGAVKGGADNSADGRAYLFVGGAL